MKKHIRNIYTTVLAVTFIVGNHTSSFATNQLLDGAWHTQSRIQHPAYTVQRINVPDEYVDWSVKYSGYNPPEYFHIAVQNEFNANGANGWAHPYQHVNFTTINPPMVSHSTFEVDSIGRPLNPYGRTGIKGRGLLGKWAANFAADPVVLRYNAANGQLEMATIVRKDNGQWAIPGGMVDPGEAPIRTALREFNEEALNGNTAMKALLDKVANLDQDTVYVGYVDDPRNTDNAWMETTAIMIVLPDNLSSQLELQGGDDAKQAKWRAIGDGSGLYASHGLIVRKSAEAFSYIESPSRLMPLMNAVLNLGDINYNILQNENFKTQLKLAKGFEGSDYIYDIHLGNYNSKAQLNNRRGLRYNSNIYQLLLGKKFYVNDVSFGFAIKFTDMHGKFKGAKVDHSRPSGFGKGEIKSLGFNVFGTAKLNNDLYLSGFANIGALRYNTSRVVDYYNKSFIVKGKSDGMHYQAGGNIGKKIAINNINVDGYMGIDAQHVTLSKYKENHHYNNDVKFISDRNSIKLRTGANLSQEYQIKDYLLTPFIDISLSYDLIRQPHNITAQTTHKHIKVKRPVDDMYDALFFNINLGVNYKINEKLLLRAGVNSEIGQKYAKATQIYTNFKFNL